MMTTLTLLSTRRTLQLLATAAVMLMPFAVSAQAWPDKSITFVVPFPPGGGTDAFARPLAAQLSRQLGKQVVIDNRGGAGGTLGAGIAAKAAPDGYTFFIGGAHHAIAPSVYKSLSYDIEKNFAPITLIASPPQVIVVNAQQVKETTLKDLIAHLKKNPGKLNYASAGNGSSHHLAGELFKGQTKTFITHIPYRGAGPALQDLIAGQVDMMFDGLGSSAPHIKSERIRALAVAAPKRSPAFPNVPTAAEAGLPGYEVSTWYGMWAPKGTPQAIMDKMHAEVQKALASPELKQVWANAGSDTPATSQAQFGAMVTAEIKRWAQVVKASGVVID